MICRNIHSSSAVPEVPSSFIGSRLLSKLLIAIFGIQPGLKGSGLSFVSWSPIKLESTMSHKALEIIFKASSILLKNSVHYYCNQTSLSFYLIWVIFICALANKKSPASSAILLPKIKSWFDGKLFPKLGKFDKSKMPFRCTKLPMWMSWMALERSRCCWRIFLSLKSPFSISVISIIIKSRTGLCSFALKWEQCCQGFTCYLTRQFHFFTSWAPQSDGWCFRPFLSHSRNIPAALYPSGLWSS